MSGTAPFDHSESGIRDDAGVPLVPNATLPLQRAGFVSRSPDPADRRRTIVSLEPGRREAVGAWLEFASAPMERALAKLSPEERSAFVKAMTYLEAELNPDCDNQAASSRKGAALEDGRQS
jgi:hypothetical protein